MRPKLKKWSTWANLLLEDGVDAFLEDCVEMMCFQLGGMTSEEGNRASFTLVKDFI